MNKLALVTIALFFLFIQGCASDKPKHFVTTGPSRLDGAWLATNCTCNGKNAFSSRVQYAYVIFINGNILLQNQTTRSKNSKRNAYCSLTEVSTIVDKGSDTFEVTRHSEQSFYPAGPGCEESTSPAQRTWKILNITASELKYVSTIGCDNGPRTCELKRIDQ